MKQTDPAGLGDQSVFLGIAATRKAVVSCRGGEPDSYSTHAFLADLRRRIVNQPEISSDGKKYHGDPAI